MRSTYFVCALFFASAYGQSAQMATPTSSNLAVAPADAVITMNGFCPDAVQGEACTTVITRAQFEKLADALQPGMPLPLQLKVANSYARNLRMAAAAEKRGLDQTPVFEEEMRFARLQLLAQDLSRALQQDADKITPAEIEQYYAKNRASFEQATLARIFVPRAKETVGSSGENKDGGNKSSEEEMANLAANLRARAARGEDPDKLQKEAYAQAGFEANTVDTKMENVRRSTLPPRHESVMGLYVGQVSEVFSDPSGAHFIYKMISKKTLPLEDAREEIRAAVSSKRYQESMKTFEGNVVFSDAYFNPPSAINVATQKSRREKKKKPAADPN